MTEAKARSGSGLNQLIADIYADEVDPLTCRLAHQLIGLVADSNLDDVAAHAQFPELFRHLGTCADCASRYRMVTEYARLEARGDIPSPFSIPPMPAGLHQAKGVWLDRLVRILFPGFSSAAPNLALRGQIEQPPVSVVLDEQGTALELQVQPSSAGAGLRTLYCTFSLPDPVSNTGLTGRSVVDALLEIEATAEEEQTVTGDLATGIVFLDIEPATYRLLLAIDDRDFLIEHIVIS